MKTRVVHNKKEPYDVYIGRPSIWGNPFSHKDIPGLIKCASREEAVANYKNWLLANTELRGKLKQLKGKVLGCWCSPLACHGDVLAELADEI